VRALELLWGEQLSRTVLPAPREQSLRCGSIPASAVSHVRFGGRASAKSIQPLRGILRCVWHVSIGKRLRRAGTRGKQKPQVPDQSWTNNPSPSRSPFGPTACLFSSSKSQLCFSWITLRVDTPFLSNSSSRDLNSALSRKAHSCWGNDEDTASHCVERSSQGLKLTVDQLERFEL